MYNCVSGSLRKGYIECLGGYHWIQVTINIKNSYSTPDVIVELGFRVQLLPRYFKPYTIGDPAVPH